MKFYATGPWVQIPLDMDFFSLYMVIMYTRETFNIHLPAQKQTLLTGAQTSNAVMRMPVENNKLWRQGSSYAITDF